VVIILLRIFGIFFLVVLMSALVFAENKKFVRSDSPADMVAAFKSLPGQNGNTAGKKALSALIIQDASDDYSSRLYKNISMSLNQMKFAVSSADIGKEDLPELKGYDLVVFAELLTDKYSETIDTALGYASAGGRLLFAGGFDTCPVFLRFAPSLGVAEIDPAYDPFIKCNQLYIEQSFAPGFEKGARASGWAAEDSAYIVSLKRGAQTYLSYALPDGGKVPVLWKYKLDKGCVVICNSYMFAYKQNRGAIAGAVINAFDAFIYPVYDSAAVFIDDFPAPIREGTFDQIKQEYDRDLRGFYSDIWWPGMIKKASCYKLKYTGLLVTTYNNVVNPPFTPENNQDILSMYAASLLANGFEMGLHGYNHNSLMVKSSYGGREPMYPPWPNIRNMELSLGQLIKTERQIFPDYRCVTYVPPSNMLSPEGRQALMAALPDLYAISGSYFDILDGEGVYVQDFGVSPDGVVNMPRISSGMKQDSSDMWVIHNGIAQYGIVSHFIHPDDMLDPERSFGLNWKGLSDSFDSLLTDIRSVAPGLRGMTAVETAIEIDKVEKLKVNMKIFNGRIDTALENFKDEVHFYAKLPSMPVKTSGCTVEKLNAEDNSLYLLKVTAPDFSVIWDEGQ